jgi:putative FmdB family regulatory protein
MGRIIMAKTKQLRSPTYGYRCETCSEIFERRESIAEHEAAEAKCPKCGSEKIVRVFSAFYAKTSKKS